MTLGILLANCVIVKAVKASAILTFTYEVVIVNQMHKKCG